MDNEKQEILIAEDDKTFRSFCACIWKRKGISSKPRPTARALTSPPSPDIILLDIMMPVWTAGGLPYHPQESNHNHTDSQDETSDRVTGWAGPTTISKPFEMREVRPIRAVMRRYRACGGRGEVKRDNA